VKGETLGFFGAGATGALVTADSFAGAGAAAAPAPGFDPKLRLLNLPVSVALGDVAAGFSTALFAVASLALRSALAIGSEILEPVGQGACVSIAGAAGLAARAVGSGMESSNAASAGSGFGSGSSSISNVGALADMAG
jgi:predicted membrane-bound dolichyl-phosphate-mannose-protein mannosyltransferase